MLLFSYLNSLDPCPFLFIKEIQLRVIKKKFSTSQPIIEFGHGKRQYNGYNNGTRWTGTLLNHKQTISLRSPSSYWLTSLVSSYWMVHLWFAKVEHVSTGTSQRKRWKLQIPQSTHLKSCKVIYNRLCLWGRLSKRRTNRQM